MTGEAYGWGFNDCDSLDNFFLVHLRTRTVEVANDRGHASLIPHSSGQMHRLLGVILGKALDLRGLSKSTEKERITAYCRTFPRCLLARLRGRKAKDP